MIVYADIVFLVNFIFNAELLVLLYRFQSRKIQLSRLLPAAILGGGLSLVAFVPYLQPYLSAASRYFVPFFMSMICFMPCDLKMVTMNGIYIYVLSFMFSGIMNFFGGTVIWGFFLIIPIFIVIDKARECFIKKHKNAELYYRDTKVTVQGFCDSGNMLMHRGKPVILAEYRVFEELFGTGFNMGAVMEWIDEKDLRYISYTSVGKSGVIPGIIIDRAIVEGRIFDKVILGYLGEGFSEKVILNSIMI